MKRFEHPLRISVRERQSKRDLSGASPGLNRPGMPLTPAARLTMSLPKFLLAPTKSKPRRPVMNGVTAAAWAKVAAALLLLAALGSCKKQPEPDAATAAATAAPALPPDEPASDAERARRARAAALESKEAIKRAVEFAQSAAAAAKNAAAAAQRAAEAADAAVEAIRKIPPAPPATPAPGAHAGK